MYLRQVSILDPFLEAMTNDDLDFDDPVGDLFLNASAMELAMALRGLTAMLSLGDDLGEQLALSSPSTLDSSA